MAEVLFGRSIPGPIGRFSRESSSTSLRRCRPCPGVAAIKLKVALLPFRLRQALNKGPPAARRVANVLSALLCSDNDLFAEPARGNSNTPLRHSLSFAIGSSTAADFGKLFWELSSYL